MDPTLRFFLDLFRRLFDLCLFLGLDLSSLEVDFDLLALSFDLDLVRLLLRSASFLVFSWGEVITFLPISDGVSSQTCTFLLLPSCSLNCPMGDQGLSLSWSSWSSSPLNTIFRPRLLS